MISSRSEKDQSTLRQKYYLQAIKSFISELEIYYGHYLTHEVKARLVDPIPGKSPFAEVYKTEEKGSDVNIALHLLNDSWLDNYDCAVLVSNDSDLATSLHMIKTQHKKNIGLIFPNIDKKRKPSRQLVQYANFVKRIRPNLLQNSQLPEVIPNTIIRKPKEWQFQIKVKKNLKL